MEDGCIDERIVQCESRQHEQRPYQQIDDFEDDVEDLPYAHRIEGCGGCGIRICVSDVACLCAFLRALGVHRFSEPYVAVQENA